MFHQSYDLLVGSLKHQREYLLVHVQQMFRFIIDILYIHRLRTIFIKIQ